MDTIKQSLQELSQHFNTTMAEFQHNLSTSIPATSPTSNISAQFSMFRTFVLSALENLQQQVEHLSKQQDKLEMNIRRTILLVKPSCSKQNSNTVTDIHLTQQDCFSTPKSKVIQTFFNFESDSSNLLSEAFSEDEGRDIIQKPSTSINHNEDEWQDISNITPKFEEHFGNSQIFVPSDIKNPDEYFRLFLTDDIIDNIVLETNKYATNVIESDVMLYTGKEDSGRDINHAQNVLKLINNNKYKKGIDYSDQMSSYYYTKKRP
ncbi:jg1479 [Pararge aegeria aegeria]|uniref:Jg1479 protein n=1 Tax=Pararge aegeria aegeria TaxID=348720 RepID=A0A8S4RP08_9NEOP|nr:jg1479 [Pararge aegeria aegeria]